jgi:hypothetical protein
MLSRADIFATRTRWFLAVSLAVFTLESNAVAQVIVPGINAPPVPPSLAPQIQVPTVPQTGAAPRQTLAPLPQSAFGDRASQCLQTGALSGLAPNDLAAYSRQCADQ